MNTKSKNEDHHQTTAKGERIAKVLARAGLCSRREAERWIAEGRVMVDGTVLTSPAVTVTPGDDIRVDGKPLPRAESTKLYLYHKPVGLVTTARDEKGRTTVFDKLPPGIGRVISIGRLDINTEGLLLLTNDGELARHLELPSTGWLRRYRVRAHGIANEAVLARLKDGIVAEGVEYGSIDAVCERQQGGNCWLSVSLREGKNREVRKALAAAGLTVNRLIRVAYGPFQLGKLPKGELRPVPDKVLQEQLAKFYKAQK